MNNLDILRNFGAIAEELNNSEITQEYLDKEERFLEKLRAEHERFNESIKMSHEKYIKPFTI